jgi:carboxylesterase type B
MQWLREEIGAFGGDQNRITLAGHGSGASAAALHLYSPLSRRMIVLLIIKE